MTRNDVMCKPRIVSDTIRFEHIDKFPEEHTLPRIIPSTTAICLTPTIQINCKNKKSYDIDDRVLYRTHLNRKTVLETSTQGKVALRMDTWP